MRIVTEVGVMILHWHLQGLGSVELATQSLLPVEQKAQVTGGQCQGTSLVPHVSYLATHGMNQTVVAISRLLYIHYTRLKCLQLGIIAVMLVVLVQLSFPSATSLNDQGLPTEGQENFLCCPSALAFIWKLVGGEAFTNPRHVSEWLTKGAKNQVQIGQ